MLQTSLCLIYSLLLPITSCLFLSFGGRYIGRDGGYFFSLVGLGCSFYLLVCSGLLKAWQGTSVYLVVFSWLYRSADWSFLFDSISLNMCLLILTITWCVVLYSSEYMLEDVHAVRFVGLLLLFAFFMLVLVSSNNFVQLFIGWEGVGMSSFLLINFWFLRLEANRSALKAMLFNRIGDTFFLLGLALIFLQLHTFDISILQNVGALQKVLTQPFGLLGHGVTIVDVILFVFFLAAVGKSAQLFLHAWLPDAMEGPTPVSSLLHSATMVTAGVFLLIRLSPLFIFSSVSNIIILCGALTAFFNGLFGFFQNDLKKIIAFSTCSQLGMMVVGVMYNATLGFYHLVNHGFFKALLFLSAGSIIHSLGGEQDIRRMGGLFLYVPYTMICMLIGSLALAGFPFLSGFYSKEFILFTLYSMGSFFSCTVFMLLFFASIFTALYSIKIVKNVFFVQSFQNSQIVLQHVHEPQFRMVIPMFLLTVLAVVFGFFNEEFFNSVGSFKFEHLVGFMVAVQEQNHYVFFNIELADVVLKFVLLVLFVSVLTFSLCKILPFENFVEMFFKTIATKGLVILFWMVSNRLGFISLYRKLTSSFFFFNYHVFFLLLDRGIFELVGPTQIVRFFKTQKESLHEVVMSFSSFFLIIFIWLFLFWSVFFFHSFISLFLSFVLLIYVILRA